MDRCIRRNTINLISTQSELNKNCMILSFFPIFETALLICSGDITDVEYEMIFMYCSKHQQIRT
jgi:hypothetical protein